MKTNHGVATTITYHIELSRFACSSSWNLHFLVYCFHFYWFNLILNDQRNDPDNKTKSMCWMRWKRVAWKINEMFNDELDWMGISFYFSWFSVVFVSCFFSFSDGWFICQFVVSINQTEHLLFNSLLYHHIRTHGCIIITYDLTDIQCISEARIILYMSSMCVNVTHYNVSEWTSNVLDQMLSNYNFCSFGLSWFSGLWIQYKSKWA